MITVVNLHSVVDTVLSQPYLDGNSPDAKSVKGVPPGPL